MTVDVTVGPRDVVIITLDFVMEPSSILSVVDEEDATVDGVVRLVVEGSSDDKTTEGCSAAGLKDSSPSDSVRVASTEGETNETLFKARIPSKELYLNYKL